MRLPKTEVERRRTAVLTFFRKNPTASVAKLNAALRSGELTGKPEKMLNIATGYRLRKEAIATPELPLTNEAPATTEAAPTVANPTGGESIAASAPQTPAVVVDGKVIGYLNGQPILE